MPLCKFNLPLCNSCLFEEGLSIHQYEIISPSPFLPSIGRRAPEQPGAVTPRAADGLAEEPPTPPAPGKLNRCGGAGASACDRVPIGDDTTGATLSKSSAGCLDSNRGKLEAAIVGSDQGAHDGSQSQYAPPLPTDDERQHRGSHTPSGPRYLAGP